MTRNNKGRAPGKDATQKTTDSRDYTGADPLIGRFNFAKPARNHRLSDLPCYCLGVARCVTCAAWRRLAARIAFRRGWFQ